MDAPPEGRTSRRKRSGGKRTGRKTRTAEDDATVVTKDEHVVAAKTAPALATVNKLIAPKVVIAPPKKKPAKVMLVPKGKTAVVSKLVKNKTFKAKSVKVMIDNSAKTRKSRADTLSKVDAMTEDQVRAAAVQARLSRRETVGKAPIGLLRQMVKDYQIMKERLQ